MSFAHQHRDLWLAPPLPGQIWLVDLEAGHVFRDEFGKRRPAIVTQHHLQASGATSTIIVPMTSDASEMGPASVYIPKTDCNHLTKHGYAKAIHVRAIGGARLIRPIGPLETATFGAVLSALAWSTGLSLLRPVIGQTACHSAA